MTHRRRFSTPQWARGAGGEPGVKPCRTQEVTPGGGGVAVALDLRLDHDDGGEPWEPRLAWEAARGGQPADVVGDGVAAAFDAAVVAVHGLVGVEGAGGRALEEQAHVLGQRRPVVLERQQVVGALGADRLGDGALAAHGVDGDQGAGHFQALER